VIEPGWRYTLDEYHNGVIERVSAAGDREPVAATVAPVRD
jgi:hypothetical protein